MATAQVLAVAVAALAVLGMVGVFVVAWRRAESDVEGVATESRDREGVPVPVQVVASEGAVRVVEAPPPPHEDEAVRAVEARRVVEVPPEEAGVTRRQFFTRAILAAFGTYLAVVGTAMVAFFWPRLAGGFGARIDAGDVEELKARITQEDGTVIPAYLPEARAYVVPFPEAQAAGTDFEGAPVIAGGLTALWQRCVHLGCRVPWCHPSQGFECPCHGSKYNLHGEYEAGPAPRNLDRFVVEVDEQGRLIIDTSQIIETPRARGKTVPYPQGPACVELGA